MPFSKYNPTSPGRRFQTALDVRRDHDADARTSRSSSRCSRSGGRNNQGRITLWWRGGGHKREYRIIDFKRDKHDIPAKVGDDRVRPEPLGAHRAAALRRRREALHPAAGRAEGGDTIVSGDDASTSCRATRCR